MNLIKSAFIESSEIYDSASDSATELSSLLIIILTSLSPSLLPIFT